MVDFLFKATTIVNSSWPGTGNWIDGAANYCLKPFHGLLTLAGKQVRVYEIIKVRREDPLFLHNTGDNYQIFQKEKGLIRKIVDLLLATVLFIPATLTGLALKACTKLCASGDIRYQIIWSHLFKRKEIAPPIAPLTNYVQASPDAVFNQIISYLPGHTWINLQGVNRAWHKQSISTLTKMATQLHPILDRYLESWNNPLNGKATSLITRTTEEIRRNPNESYSSVFKLARFYFRAIQELFSLQEIARYSTSSNRLIHSEGYHRISWQQISDHVRDQPTNQQIIFSFYNIASNILLMNGKRYFLCQLHTGPLFVIKYHLKRMRDEETVVVNRFLVLTTLDTRYYNNWSQEPRPPSCMWTLYDCSKDDDTEPWINFNREQTRFQRAYSVAENMTLIRRLINGQSISADGEVITEARGKYDQEQKESFEFALGHVEVDAEIPLQDH